jgi:hypothetical protein
MENKAQISGVTTDAKIHCTSITSERFAELKTRTHFLIAVVQRTVEPIHQTEIVFEEGKDIPIPDGYKLKTVSTFIRNQQ